MTDQELVAWVAEHVMGWADKGMREHHVATFGSCRPLTVEMRPYWRPLDDWNDCMMVLDAMESKGLGWTLAKTVCEYRSFHIVFWKDIGNKGGDVELPKDKDDVHSRRRAILLAAKAAILSSQEALEASSK